MKLQDNQMTTDEEVFLRGEPAEMGQFSLYFCAFLFAITLYGIPISVLFLCVAYINIKTLEIVITNKRFAGKKGWLSVNMVDIPLKKVESVIVNQGILGRMFNYGSIVVSGSGGVSFVAPNIKKPHEFRKMALEALSDDDN